MSEAGVASCTPTKSEPGASAMNAELDLDATPALEPTGKKRKDKDVSRETLYEPSWSPMMSCVRQPGHGTKLGCMGPLPNSTSSS